MTTDPDLATVPCAVCHGPMPLTRALEGLDYCGKRCRSVWRRFMAANEAGDLAKAHRIGQTMHAIRDRVTPSP
jgi:hypothetical protein